MSDVAALAGVSHQTVSRVLNGTGRVAPATRERIHEAISTLGYRRNSVARALASKRSGIIGIITTTEVHFGPASSLVNVEIAAREAGYFTGLTVVADYGPTALTEAIDHFLGLAVEAIIVIAPIEGLAKALDLIEVPVPLVAIAAVNEVDEMRVLTVQIDQRGGAALATRHLIGLGHEDIVHIAGPAEWYEARARIAGWREALEEAGLPVREPLGFGWDSATGYTVMKGLIDSDELPSAVFASNDALALGAYKALAEAGLSIPGEVSVVGFDNLPSSEFFTPALTTVGQDFAALGRRAIEGVRAAIAEGGAARMEMVPTSLVIRDSTAAPRRPG